MRLDDLFIWLPEFEITEFLVYSQYWVVVARNYFFKVGGSIIEQVVRYEQYLLANYL